MSLQHAEVECVCFVDFLWVFYPTLTVTPFSLPFISMLRGYTVQHLPDGTVIVESIVLKVSSSSDDPNLKVILLSWSYQVNVREKH